MAITVKREKCATCLYFDEAAPGANGGLCVRRPPVVILVYGEGSSPSTLFPDILSAKTTWCGEWEDAS